MTTPTDEVNKRFRKTELGLESVQYIREQLSMGSTLARKLLELPLEQGKVFTYAPMDVRNDILQDLEHSIFLRSGMKVTDLMRQRIAKFIAQFLNSNRKRCAIFETLMEIGDRVVNLGDLPRARYEREIYLYLTSRQYGENTIANVLMKARGYPFIGALTSGNLQDPKRGSALLNLRMSDFDGLATNTLFIVIGSYDNEGYVVWQRPLP